jgi:DHA2 family multidrug resistance protein
MNRKSIWFETRTIVALALSMLALAEIVDLTIVAVALPNLMGSLGANINQISLTLTSYIVAAAVFIPLTGFVTKKYGVKKVSLISALIFGIASILCGLSNTLTEMVIFRTIQGIGGAFLPALAQGYIVDNYTVEERPKIMMVYSLCVVMGPIAGPLFGGFIVESLSWRWIFYVNVPLCIIAGIILYLFMQESKKEHINTDYISFIFLALGVGCLEFFLDEGNQNNWFESKEIVIVFAIGILATIFFIWRGILGKSVVNFAIFESRTFNISSFLIFSFMICAVMSLAYYPTLLQQGYNYSVSIAGVTTSPRGVFAFFAAPIFINLARKFDPRKILFIAMFIYMLACYTTIHYGVNINKTLILTSLSLQGFGLSGTFIVAIQIAFSDTPNILSNDASGVFNFFRNIGNSVGTSIAATVLSRQQQTVWSDLSTNIKLYNNQFNHFTYSFANYPLSLKLNLSVLLIKLQAFVLANINLFYLSFIGMLCIMWIPFILKKPKISGDMPSMH